MFSVKKLGNFKGNDVELCRTTNKKVSNQTTDMLLEHRIPFSKMTKRIPFFKRDKYDGASEVFVININPHSYSKARRAIDELEVSSKKALLVSNY